jgi:hypothetical protein
MQIRYILVGLHEMLEHVSSLPPTCLMSDYCETWYRDPAGVSGEPPELVRIATDERDACCTYQYCTAAAVPVIRTAAGGPRGAGSSPRGAPGSLAAPRKVFGLGWKALAGARASCDASAARQVPRSAVVGGSGLGSDL